MGKTVPWTEPIARASRAVLAAGVYRALTAREMRRRASSARFA